MLVSVRQHNMGAALVRAPAHTHVCARMAVPYRSAPTNQPLSSAWVGLAARTSTCVLPSP